MEGAAFADKVTAACRRMCGGTHDIQGLRRLSGGANMESWWLEYNGRALVLRRLPEGASELDLPGRIDLNTEAKVISAAQKHGVKAPEIIGTLTPEDGLGPGFFMAAIEGETLPQKIFRDPDCAAAVKNLSSDCALALSKIHAVPMQNLPDGLPRHSPQEMVTELARQYESWGASIPVFDLAIGWLLENLPTPREPVLLHGDFRMGNLMIDTDGLSGVLDWELAHLGDPAQDIGYLCTPSWRFGQYEKTVGGLGALPAFLEIYNRETGAHISERDVTYWMIYSALWWGTVCVSMAEFWRSGLDRSLERAVIGRRTSETEIDLMLMLEEVMGLTTEPLDWQQPDPVKAAGETGISELLAALEDWNANNNIENASGRAKFAARVAGNALGILKRGAERGRLYALEKAKRLKALGLTPQSLCVTCRAGEVSPELAAHLRVDLLERLSIDQPKYAGYKAALEKWVKADV